MNFTDSGTAKYRQAATSSSTAPPTRNSTGQPRKWGNIQAAMKPGVLAPSVPLVNIKTTGVARSRLGEEFGFQRDGIGHQSPDANPGAEP